MHSTKLHPVSRLIFLPLAILGFWHTLGMACDDAPQQGIATAIDGTAIHYSSHGCGLPALVFVHGILNDQNTWHEQLSHFSRNYQVVTLDLGGHGKSGTERDDWTMQAFGSDVAAVVKRLELESVVLIGHSMGGAVIFETADQLPGRIKSLVAVDTYDAFSTWFTPEENEVFLKPFRDNFAIAARPWVQSMFREDADPEFVERKIAQMSAAPPGMAVEMLEAAIEAMFGHKRSTVLRGLEAPVFVINSDNGFTDVNSLEKDGVNVQIIADTGHFLIIENSEAFNASLAKVIDEIVD